MHAAPPPPRFNGAAGFRPRRLGGGGHRNAAGFTASMGPRAFAHGDHPERKNFLSPPRKLQWGRGLSPTETSATSDPPTQPRHASMGPRAFAHGDIDVSLLSKPSTSLQWGRGLSPTETWRNPGVFRPLFVLQWGRGLSPTETLLNASHAAGLRGASMGPRAFAHGDAIPRFDRHNGQTSLQWGRGLSPTETPRPLHGRKQI